VKEIDAAVRLFGRFLIAIGVMCGVVIVIFAVYFFRHFSVSIHWVR